MSLFQTFGAVAAATLLVGVPPANAQHRGGGHSRGGGGGGHAASVRAAAPRSFGAPRIAAPRSFGSARAVSLAPRSYSYGRSFPSGGSRVYAAQRRGGAVIGHAVARGGGPRVVGGARYGYSPYRFYRPYYAFRPRLSLGFGLWVGFPISYPYYYGYYDPYYAYGYPYPAYGYPYPYSGYGYSYPAASYPAYPSAPAYPPSAYPQAPYPQSAYPPPSGSPGAPPNQANMGGVSFEITPPDAEVYVDGSYVGTAGEFTATTQPLGLTPGRHYIEIRAAGYRTMAFDTDIVAGQVIPYQGVLQR